jgi:hypothetical protein
MKRISLAAALLAAIVLAFAGIASAGKVGQMKLWVYDPSNIGGAVATWTKDGLSLQKNTDTANPVAAGATFKGVEGDTLSQLSFDVKGYCGAGAPRFDVFTADSTLFYGCTYGTHTDLGNGWTHVEFKGTEPNVPALGATITGVEVVQDEQGKTLLRNISVNGVSVDKFSQS